MTERPLFIHGRRNPKEVGGVDVRVVMGKGVEIPLPHIKKHSPDGFEWGYAGSGPAELALAILAYVTGEGEKMAERPDLYQRFKFDVIAVWPKDVDLFIPFTLIFAWLVRLKVNEDLGVA